MTKTRTVEQGLLLAEALREGALALRHRANTASFEAERAGLPLSARQQALIEYWLQAAERLDALRV